MSKAELLMQLIAALLDLEDDEDGEEGGTDDIDPDAEYGTEENPSPSQIRYSKAGEEPQ